MAATAVSSHSFADFLPIAGYLLMTGINGLMVVLDLDVTSTEQRICVIASGALTSDLWSAYARNTKFIVPVRPLTTRAQAGSLRRRLRNGKTRNIA
ncbi:hypothetical protein [Nocardia sp. NPDC004860]|uniref:hypothetical protein n=1 Tax=Nocardia sp. NPDC004860 TaxID=3154557 RepID=UPI0033A3BFA6